MYYVIQKKNDIFLNFFSFGQSMKNIMMVKEIKCLQNIVVEMY